MCSVGRLGARGRLRLVRAQTPGNLSWLLRHAGRLLALPAEFRIVLDDFRGILGEFLSDRAQRWQL